MATEKGWGIAGSFGLYVGWHMTRAAAIRDHVVELLGIGQKLGPLTAAQKRAWKEMQKEGDRAVKVTVTYR